ncbi:septal ring lytic transglycosylase RlpA family protein [Pseudoluteimonas lycopersici]|uniref:Endolytic peptidoglycan transglycosylase RlpA n=1 Tax=Pseudoluteimonas lycopersici TaxID=1324796 RepID=A0A516V703_9GAMM|nr:septal ring lytic transglycosylase RlpA family protein [Lysobacter lycopersici]QDQ74298.1 septal ring lytic transglycosylase RlpA family protein [Lysobacter lycopersici]
MRALLASSIVLALAACAAAPQKQAPPVASSKPKPAHPASTRSPYAPAQEDVSKRGGMVGDLYKPDEPDTVPADIPDVDAIPDATPQNEARSRYGNRSYSVLGKRYQVLESAEGYDEVGIASFYGNKFHGRRTSNLEVYDMYAMTAAHKTLPLPSYARVTNLDNGRSIVVRVNDRGPFHAGRIIDLSYAAAVKLGYRDKGTARVEVKGLAGPYDDASEHGGVLASAATPQQEAHVATGKPTLAPQPNVDTAMDKLVDALPIAAANAGERVAPAIAAADPANRDLRFDMRQDGRTMTADEFDAWMRTRRVRVATGQAGKPDSALSTAVASDAAKPAPAALEPAIKAPPPPPATAAAVVAATTPAAGDVTLQVASFGNEQNAQRALAMLQGASIPGAQLQGADVAGKRVWRLRIGPVAASNAPELAARVVGLGFGQPQRVRD